MRTSRFLNDEPALDLGQAVMMPRPIVQTTPPLPPPVVEWDAVIGGDRAALESLFRVWMPIIMERCRRLGGPRVDADHAAQEIFIVVLRRVHTVTAEQVFPSWLFGVTRRVLAQHRRAAFSSRWDANREPELGVVSAGPDHIVAAARRVATVRAVIDKLPDDLREVLVVCDLEERTDTEAASILGIPDGTLKSRKRRARGRFRALADAQGLGGVEPRVAQEGTP
jgi:RNA polymerase sigma-70 factor, ECF subfamily